ncbi:Werner helicase interacting protein 1 [Aspergillus alliaceus]|uniref:Werner helicase interacting protein 1 n=1 Tax=Petromyces alliaceus TaxID=209559 RepID=A0A8H6A643_PETAA|nr:Werner helicase interacting protein 1 [Aspergillus burnettii]
MVECPICQKVVLLARVNQHIDSECKAFHEPGPYDRRCHKLAEPGSLPCKTGSTDAVAKGREPSSTHRDIPIQSSIKDNAKRPSSQQQCRTQENHTSKTAVIQSLVKRRKPDITPLAESVRPRCFDDIVGQQLLVGPNGTIRKLVQTGNIPNMILWGSSGTGKTTIARIVASTLKRRIYEIDSTMTTQTEYANTITKASQDLIKERKPSIVFCDEIHRITKPQQDILLDAVKNCRVVLIGATTENPSLAIRHGLVYRCRVFTLAKPTDIDIRNMLHRIMESQVLQSHLLEDEFIGYLASFADGDCRVSLNLLEIAHNLSKRDGMTKDRLKDSLTKHLVYDRVGDQHYDTISAFHKSVRGSDPDAALYYLARMLKSGENPLFIARRLIVATSEDIGLADNSLQTYATSVYSVLEKVGIEDAQASLAQLVVMMCLTRKSTRSYRGLNNAFSCLKEPGAADTPIPARLLPISSEIWKFAGDIDPGREYDDEATRGKFLPNALKGRKLLDDTDFLFKRDPDISY